MYLFYFIMSLNPSLLSPSVLVKKIEGLNSLCDYTYYNIPFLALEETIPKIIVWTSNRRLDRRNPL